MISSSFNKTAHLHTGHVTLRFFEQSTFAFVPPDLWLPIAPTLIRSITRYGVTSSSEYISHSCKLHSNDKLKKRLLDSWHGKDQSVIDDAIDG